MISPMEGADPFGLFGDPDELRARLSEMAEQMQGAQRVAWADNAIKLAVDMTVAAIARLELTGSTDEQAMQVRDAIRIVPRVGHPGARGARGLLTRHCRDKRALGCRLVLASAMQVDRRRARNGEAGAATIEHAGLSLLIALIAVGLLAALASSPSPAGRELGFALAAQAALRRGRPGPCWRDPLTEAYGRPLAGAVRALAPPPRRPPRRPERPAAGRLSPLPLGELRPARGRA